MKLPGNRDIVCLASQAWDSHRCTPQQISERLGEHTRVLYVEPLRSPLVRFSRSATQSRRRATVLESVAPQVWRLTLPAVFMPLVAYARWPFLRRYNNALMSWMVNRVVRRLGLVDPIVWIYQPTHEGAPLVDRACFTVYDCIDEWAAATPVPRLQSFLSDLDRRLCESADLLFVGSSGLAESRIKLNASHALIPQGVDLRHFLAPADGTPAPDDLSSLPRPLVGLVGVLNKERVDVGLLCHLASAHPDWSLVLVGPVWEGLDTDALKRFSNIHLLGNKPPEQLGRYLAAFDVCLLPYIINDFTRNIFPLKLYEYLASGKPFVSTPVPACLEFPRLIRVAEGPAAFLQAVEQALEEDDLTLRNERIALAMANDWDRRAQEKLARVAEQLEARSRQGADTGSRNIAHATAR